MLALRCLALLWLVLPVYSCIMLCLVLNMFFFFFWNQSDFEDSFQDRQRISGGLSSHSYKRNEYGSSPPTRGDFSSYSRGVHGRWEGRPSARSDKDSSDSQSDLESGRIFHTHVYILYL